MNVFDYAWNSDIVTGKRKADKPDLITFANTHLFVYLLNNAIERKESVMIHCDVDVDGIGTGYILGRFIEAAGGLKPSYIINKSKEHGINEKHVNYFKNNKTDLLIIVDSGSNDIEYIKNMNCNVLVIDHHEVEHSDLKGITNDGKHSYAIINNTIQCFNFDVIKKYFNKINTETFEKLKEYVVDDRMSCGLVIYELLRVYQELFKLGNILENLRLYQWVGITLFTDEIELNNERNQWYVEHTVNKDEVESNLNILIKELNPYKYRLDKSFICYTLAPTFNRAIRAEKSSEALDIVINHPEQVSKLSVYRKSQDIAIEKSIEGAYFGDTYVIKDNTYTGISNNYSGVVGSRLCGDYNKNAFVYHVDSEGIAKGSFRGRINNLNYLEFINSNNLGIAQGHKSAFGLKCKSENVHNLMQSLQAYESQYQDKLTYGGYKYLLTAGVLNEIERGLFVIEDIEKFKKDWGIWSLAVGNSRVSNKEQILLTVSIQDVKLCDTKGKIYIYDILGLKCKAFKPISDKILNIYAEYSTEIDLYIK